MPGPARTSRRGALAAAATLALLTGCDTEDLKPHDRPRGASTPTPGQPTADEQLVDTIVTAVTAAVGTVAVAHRFPVLRSALTPLLQAHRAHLGVLSTKKPARSTGPRPASAADALTGVRQLETTLQAQLVDAAVRAESGALARLFASMSASVAQYVAVLPATVSTP